MHQTITRRRFLVGSAQLALVTSAGVACAPGPRPEHAALAPDVSPSAWSDLARRLSGRVLRPGAASWSRIVTPNNLVFNAFPAGVARCASANDVAQSILWAREYKMPFVARCGGHSYAGYSTTPGLMIDLGLLNRVDVDPATRIATVGGGVLNSTCTPRCKGSASRSRTAVARPWVSAGSFSAVASASTCALTVSPATSWSARSS
jgi:hypothetical protein